MSVTDSSRVDTTSSHDTRHCSSPDDSERSHSPRSVSDTDHTRHPASPGQPRRSTSPESPRPSSPVKTDHDDDDRQSYASSERGSPRAADEDTPQTNPPNLTIIQPSVNHPMLSYLYQTGLYSAPHPMSFPVSPMMFSSGAAMAAAAAAAAAAHGSSLPGMPFLPTSLAGSDLSAHFPSAAGLTGGSGMMLTNPLAMAGHSLWQQTYAAALSGHGSSAFDSPSTTMQSAFGPLFASRTLNSPHRFAPYGFPFTKSTSSAHSPLAAHGLRSPIVDLSRPVSPTSPLGRRCSMPSPAHSSPGSVSSRSSGAPSSELKNIERMVSGLERRHERLGAVADK